MPPKGYRRPWTDVQYDFMEWLCLPTVEREGQSYVSIARVLGVDRNTLHTWEGLPGFKEAVGAMARRTILSLEPNYLKTIATDMMSKKPSDRIVMTYWRYIRPALLAEYETTEALLPRQSDNQRLLESRQAEIWKEIQALDSNTRDIVVNLWRKMIAEPGEGEVELIAPPEFHRVRRLAAPDDDVEAVIEAEPAVEVLEAASTTRTLKPPRPPGYTAYKRDKIKRIK